MKKTLLSLISLLAVIALAQTNDTEIALKAGSAVKIGPVTNAKWIQGDPLKEFEPGKVYMFECWATWCGPCVASIPHVNELHKKYSAKGLRVIGMNVWEDGDEKVAKFVKGKGDGMTYPIAYTGKGSAFETEWLKAAGVRGIPHAFIVKDGHILLMAHPAMLSDEVIEGLLSGDEGIRKTVAKIEAENAGREKMSALSREFQMVANKGDTGIMAAKLAELEKLDPEIPSLPQMRISLLVAKKDWPGAKKVLDDATGPAREMALSSLARRLGTEAETNCPVEFLKTVATDYATQVEKRRVSPLDFTTLAALQWKTGDKEAALGSARKGVEAAKAIPEGRIPVAPFEKYVKALEQGGRPTDREFAEWWTQESKAKAAVPASEVKRK